jgi:phosphate starvation-inducible protein PhoH and related proteins
MSRKYEASSNVTLSEDNVTAVLGVQDENVRVIEDAFNVRISARGNEIFVQGDTEQVATVERLIREMHELIDRGRTFKKNEVITSVRVLREDPNASIVEFFEDDAAKNSANKRLATARNIAQKNYLAAIGQHDMTFAIGPAGTGKTYLAVAVAAAALNDKSVKRIILCRPAVEAGEKLGFLPGDMVEKINPYLRPLYDALYDMIGFEKVAKLIERNVIEIAPLAFMRGRTLSDSFIILDEAQNTTPEQMKMFVTRLGMGSKAVITGDVTQVDLPGGTRSGLAEARRILGNVQGVSFFEFTEKDVVRHPLVGRIISALRPDRS